ncbi:MAG: hypothetical protein WA126_08320 [Thermodesulfovibrionales bacterium]
MEKERIAILKAELEAQVQLTSLSACRLDSSPAFRLDSFKK